MLLIVPIVFIALAVSFIVRKRSNKSEKVSDLQLSISREDTLGQSFLLLSIFFLGVTLLAFNNKFGEIISWRTILFVTVIFGLGTSYYLKAVVSLAFSLIGFCSWWISQSYYWSSTAKSSGVAAITGFAFLGLAFYVISYFQGKNPKYKRMTLVYFILGIFIITGLLFFFSTQIGIEFINGVNSGNLFINAWQGALMILIYIIVFILALAYAAYFKLMSFYEAAVLAILGILFILILFIPEKSLLDSYHSGYSYNSSRLSGAGILWAIIFNVVVFFETLGIIFLGYLKKEEWIINLGVLFLFILIFIKYFDWFFTFLDKSIFFIGAGILMFAIGWFMERSRKYLISNIKNPDPAAILSAEPPNNIHFF